MTASVAGGSSAGEDATELPPVVDPRTPLEGSEPLINGRRPPHSVYRLQFHAAFGFAAAFDIVDYLADLGISHVYASPILKTRRGSTHGYDIVNPSQLNDELGAEADFTRFSEALNQRGLGLIQDVVPNHMSVGTDENAWWLDVLTHGPASRYSAWFDIDWHPIQPELENKVLLPILPNLSGSILESGGFVIAFELGAFFLRFQTLQLPLDPGTWPQILQPHVEQLVDRAGADDPQVLELQSILVALDHLPSRSDTSPDRVAERHRESVVVRNRLRVLEQQSLAVSAHITGNVQQLNGAPGDAHSFDDLDRLLSAQAYQLVHWKAGSDEMNYRRFFDVTELAAISMEHPEVFEESHRLLLDLAARGTIDGFRIDHIDGLFAPTEYLWRLQAGFVDALRRERDTSPGTPNPVAPVPLDRTQRLRLPLYVTVEKILGADEPLPTEWPVQGTTGYDFLNLLNGLFLNPRGLQLLERHYVRFTEARFDRRETTEQSKHLIVDGVMQSELQLLAHRLNRLSKRHRRSRDYTLQALRAALREMIAAFSVYRTYVHDGNVSERDRGVILRAVAHARRRNPAIDAGVFNFVRDVVLLEQPADLDSAGRAERDQFIGRLQQVTSPVMAKGIEDTAFYRYFPLISINEVGSEPEHPITSVAGFHEQNSWRHAHWPRSFLATTTHDTKRSEDVRTRLHVLTEIPGVWKDAVQRWARWNRRHRSEVEGEPAPSRNDEWLLYQTLVGIWSADPVSDDEHAVLVDRVQQYMQKAIHEAKLRSSWINPNAAYDAAVRDFVAKLLLRGSRFLGDLETFVAAIADSGCYNSISQLLLKLMSPGVPDIYQGQEFWDFSLVDPDNRRPVDYARRKQLLAELRTHSATDDARQSLARTLAQSPRDDRLKLYVTWMALQVRRVWSDFVDAEYVPLEVRGSLAEHVCAFAWIRTGVDRPQVVVVAAPRLIHTLTAANASRLPSGALWLDTAIQLDRIPSTALRDRMTARRLQPVEGWLPVATLLSEFPVALATSDK